MIVYRIGMKNYVSALIPSGIAGRWASAGRNVIYCAESIPLAFLENMIRRQGVGFKDDYKIAIIDIPDVLEVMAIAPDDLEDGWRAFNDYTICQEKGNSWYDEMKYPVLKVPSAILLMSNNFVLNVAFPDFKKIKIIGITDLAPDDRIEDILKNYKKT